MTPISSSRHQQCHTKVPFFAFNCVLYSRKIEVVYGGKNPRDVYISNPTDFPDMSDPKQTADLKEIQEPVVKASMIFPEGMFDIPSEIQFPFHAQQNIWVI